MEKLIPKIEHKIKKAPLEYQAYQDLFDVCREIEESNHKKAHDTNEWLRARLISVMRDVPFVEPFFQLYRRTLLFDAPHKFDCYLQYLEIDRKPEERFYLPRRKILKRVVDALQELVDDELDELFISMPPRVGKTTILLFFVTWLIGRNSEKSNLYSAYSDTITSAFYDGVLEIIQDPFTYLWADVFPSAKIVEKNAKEEKLNIDREKRYHSLTCRSLYGTLNGACDCNGFLIMDDLIGGIEEALNRDRLIAAWSKVDNNLLPRAKETAKILWCGTRWSVIDPAGKRIDLLENDERYKNRRYKIINLSALDENDESQFDYDYQVGYSTDYYKQRRASFERSDDMASWFAQYMGTPIEREGALFSSGNMRYYDGRLPDAIPDRVFMAVDPAYGGGDFVASPVCIEYGDDIYVADVVYDNRDKTFTQPLLASAVLKYEVKAMRLEATKATEGYKDGIELELKNNGYKLKITTKPAPSNKSKAQRIFDRAPDICSRFIFLESGKRSKTYEAFMQNVFSYKIMGKNKHDDAPDSLAMAADMACENTGEYSIFARPF